MNVIDLIMRCAAVPSFSTYEERLHPVVEELAAGIGTITHVPTNNLIIDVPGKRDLPPVALTAHLDKINHFGEDLTQPLPVRLEDNKLIGLLDDSVGLGICLSLMCLSRDYDFPPLLLLFSEMEEGMGLRRHPHLLKDGGEGLYSGIGADRIADYLIDQDRLPGIAITIDTTPLFKGESGVALYCDHWKLNELKPSQALIDATARVQTAFQRIHPGIHIGNNTNDYLNYGYAFNRAREIPIPSVALEPAIFPYHQAEEGVYVSDIEAAAAILIRFLETFEG